MVHTHGLIPRPLTRQSSAPRESDVNSPASVARALTARALGSEWKDTQMRLADFISRADELIKKADEVLRTEHKVASHRFVDEESFRAFRASVLSFLVAIFGKDHTYYTEFNARVTAASSSDTRKGRGILLAAREEIAGGWLQTTKGLVSAEIFADFLEMAEHLLEQDYKDPAAVVVGSVLEEHLRHLCQKNGIPTEVVQQGRSSLKKADALNSDLAKTGVYNKLDHKNVTAWLDLRNKAAHGKYQEYSKEQVALMLQGVSDFVGRVPV